MIANWIFGPLLLALLAAGCATPGDSPKTAFAAEAKSVGFLKREVPAWRRDNGCFSCHNNGDAARALFAANRMGHRIPTGALADTLGWITQPNGWDHNKGEPGFSDKKLADVQFAAALFDAVETGHVKDQRPLQAAIEKLLPDQDVTGAWPIEPKTAIGSPATYGTPLATYMTLRTLRQVKAPGTEPAIRKAEEWLRQARPDNMPAAAAILMAFAGVNDEAANGQRNACLDLIRRGQTPDGGWGPYADSPPEAFDTALVLLALRELPATPEFTQMIRRGRNYLLASQMPEGSWPATTRPAGGSSYAQQLSTTGWATLALLATRR